MSTPIVSYIELEYPINFYSEFKVDTNPFLSKEYTNSSFKDIIESINKHLPVKVFYHEKGTSTPIETTVSEMSFKDINELFSSTKKVVYETNILNRSKSILDHYETLYNPDSKGIYFSKGISRGKHTVKLELQNSSKLYYAHTTKDSKNNDITTYTKAIVSVIRGENVDKQVKLFAMMRGMPVMYDRFDLTYLGEDKYNCIFRFPEHILGFEDAVNTIDSVKYWPSTIVPGEFYVDSEDQKFYNHNGCTNFTNTEGNLNIISGGKYTSEDEKVVIK